MAKVWFDQQEKGPPRLRGVLQVQGKRGGGYVAMSWHKPQGKSKSPDVNKTRQMWGRANHHSVTALSIDAAAAEELSQGTPFLRRDLLMMAAYGNLIEARYKDGRVMRGERMSLKDIQVMLDTISEIPGTLLMRTAEAWVGLEPVETNYVLTDGGPGVLPSWQPAQGQGPAGGDVQSYSFFSTSLTTSVSNHAMKGTIFQATEDQVVWSMAPIITPTAGAVYKLACGLITGYPDTPTLQSVALSGDLQDPGGSNPVAIAGRFDGGILIPAGSIWYAATVRIDGTDTSRVETREGSGSTYQGYGPSAWLGNLTADLSDPRVGDPVSHGSSPSNCMLMGITATLGSDQS